MSSNSGSSRGAFVVSLDFELFWGMRDVVSLDGYRPNLDGTPAAIERLLDLFEAREIHATWACVGLLFAQNSADAQSFAPRLRPSYRARELSPFEALDRSEPDRTPGCYFAPELIQAIAARPHQEIGTHTFSHYYANEAGQTAAQFDADLEAAVAIAKRSGVQLESLVFPRNQCNADYLPILARHGIRSYRGLRAGWAFKQSKSKIVTTVRRGLRLADNYSLACRDGATDMDRIANRPHALPINIPGSRFLRPYNPQLRDLEGLRMHRMQSEMAHAAENGRVYHLWWHPHNFGVHTAENLTVLDNLLRHARALDGRVGFPSLTMAELARASGS